MLQNSNQNSVFEDVGMVAGMKGVAITEHAYMVTACTAWGSQTPEMP
jgi:hypothetical protein